MGSGIARAPKPQWMRWSWFTVAAMGLLTTPGAVTDAVREGRTDHKMIAIMVLAFSIRFGMIGLFLDLWWKSRPLKEK